MADDQVQDVARALGMKPGEVVAVEDTDDGVSVALFDGSKVLIVDGEPFIVGGDPETSKLPVWAPPADDEAPADEDDEPAPAKPARPAKKAAVKAPADEADDA